MAVRKTPLQLVLDNLHREVDLIEEELKLLKDIDQWILDRRNKQNLEGLFTYAARRFTEIHGPERPLLCYINTGSEFVQLSDGGRSDHPERIQIATRFSAPSQEVGPNPSDVVLLSRGEDVVFEYFEGKLSILLYPIFSEQRDLVCCFLVADTAEKSASHLHDHAFANSVSSVASQLAIAFNHHDQFRRLTKLQQVWATFLASNLSPERCFKAMAYLVPAFLPDFGPMRFDGEGPRVQIMIRNDGGSGSEELLIRGSTGTEHERTRLAVDRSITGLLIENDESALPFFCDDPRDPKNIAHRGRFKAYLGRDIRTELAVRIFDNDRVVGVLNLESETPDAFNRPHIDAMRDLGRIIGPIVMVFERRLELISTVQLSVASSTARYLDGLASVYRHSIRTPMRSLEQSIDLAINGIDLDIINNVERALQLASAGETAKIAPLLHEVVAASRRTRERIDRLNVAYTQLSGYNAAFLRDISGYSENRPINLLDIVAASVKLVNDSLLTPEGTQIEIEYGELQADATTRVYCSPLLKQHLYSVFDNAVNALKDRLEKDPRLGTIWISIKKDSLPPGQEVALNTSWAVSIKDNGNGVTPEDLALLKKFEPGTSLWRSKSTGSGLVALQRFMNSIGGHVELKSTWGESFEVILHIYEDRPNI